MEGREEVKSPVRKCRYGLRQCSDTALDGFHFCITHILEDKNAPYEQCCYISCKTGRRCAQPAKKTPKKDGLCAMHVTKINRSRCAIARKQLDAQTESAESLLEDLEHYSSTLYNNTRGDRRYAHTESASFLAELASSSDSDADDRTFLQLSNYLPDSDSESVDSEGEDTFKYAEVLTEEEATRITRDKLIKLQSLYIDQFKWLQYVLKERRRKYLHDRQKEIFPSSACDGATTTDRDTGSHNSPEPLCKKIVLGDDVTSRKYFSLRRYHRKHGKEALMYLKSQERRKALGDQSIDSHTMNRYRHASRHGTKHCSIKNVKCCERSLPFARYCTKHIELDAQQVLFRRCGCVAVDGGLACERPVVNYNDHVRCRYHNNNADQLASQSTPEADKSETVNIDVVDENKLASPSQDYQTFTEEKAEVDPVTATAPILTADIIIDPYNASDPQLTDDILVDPQPMEQVANG